MRCFMHGGSCWQPLSVRRSRSGDSATLAFGRPFRHTDFLRVGHLRARALPIGRRREPLKITVRRRVHHPRPASSNRSVVSWTRVGSPVAVTDVHLRPRALAPSFIPPYSFPVRDRLTPICENNQLAACPPPWSRPSFGGVQVRCPPPGEIGRRHRVHHPIRSARASLANRGMAPCPPPAPARLYFTGRDPHRCPRSSTIIQGGS